jgi:hypothetical protein
MLYKVSGSNKDTGARMTLEFQAESKAAAERKANQSGMNVLRVEDVTDGESAKAYQSTGRKKGGGGMMKLIILIILIAVSVYFIGVGQIMHWLHLSR